MSPARSGAGGAEVSHGGGGREDAASRALPGRGCGARWPVPGRRGRRAARPAPGRARPSPVGTAGVCVGEAAAVPPRLGEVSGAAGIARLPGPWWGWRWPGTALINRERHPILFTQKTHIFGVAHVRPLSPLTGKADRTALAPDIIQPMAWILPLLLITRGGKIVTHTGDICAKGDSPGTSRFFAGELDQPLIWGFICELP